MKNTAIILVTLCVLLTACGVGVAGLGQDAARLAEAQQALSVKPGDTCAEAPLVVLTDHGTLLGTTLAGKNADYTSATPGCGDTSGSAPDAVVKMRAPTAGVIELRILGDSHASFTPALYLRSASTCTSADIACAEDEGEFAIPRAQLWHDVEPGDYDVIVDGHGPGAGPYSLYMALHPRVCGDGIVSPGEQCDSDPGDDTCIDPGQPNECQFAAPASPNS